jgi:predicted AlkP superfamily phosphohydrolase/phosphomutase
MKLLVIGLDGLEPSLVEQFSKDLPTLDALRREGRWGPLESTLPYATFPAWSSFLTGVNPGEHGIFDFARLRPRSYELEFVGGAIRRRPTVARLASDSGLRVASLGFPGSFPPEPLNGVVIGGFDSPVAVSADASFVHPPELAAELDRRFGGWRFADFSETRTWVPGWHRRAADRLLAGVERRAAICRWLMQREAFDLFMVHFGASDTAAHHFWAFHDPNSPRRPDDTQGLASVLRDVYIALDRAVAGLIEQSGAETVLLASDHGFGGSGDKVVYLNRFLSERGYLRWQAGAGRPSAFGVATGAALALAPGQVQQWLWRVAGAGAGKAEASRRFRGIEWGGTVAYSEELSYHPSIRLNVAGREPLGALPVRGVDALLEELVDVLVNELRDPWTGAPVVRRAWRREDLYSGPAVADAPELILDMDFDAGYAYNCLSSGGPGPVWRRLEPSERLGRKGAGMNGTHRRDGFWLARGPGVAARRKRARMVDMAPTMLTALGLGVPSWLEGCSHVRSDEPVQAMSTPASPQTPWRGYAPAQQAVIEERLRKLGYI